MRVAVLGLAFVGACGVKLADDPTSHVVTDAPGSSPDGAGPLDAAIPVDARVCEGGQKHQTGPNNECFVFFSDLVTWAQAKLACEGISAHLAILDAPQKDNVAETMLTVDTFIGGTDAASEGNFVWLDGTPITAATYTNWHAGEPNNGNGNYPENCIVVAGARLGKAWDDRPCLPELGTTVTAGKYGYLCEY